MLIVVGAAVFFARMEVQVCKKILMKNSFTDVVCRMLNA
ncbi:hypothetical protein PU02_1261 [Bartonella ancashensis]|uniref:Uncharacterized protein n=1 Tax=Bartonella ancashensis TaxID=1318743 RepID=A0A0M3T391_9HYPH|nr:hypothetical protein PU02_1261 [Bartonella ancashensis]